MDRVYIVVRKDLPVGLQMAQACHAARAWGGTPPHDENLVVLHAENEDHLRGILERLHLADVSARCFQEPDLGYQLTAIATDSWAKKYLRNLPLAR